MNRKRMGGSGSPMKLDMGMMSDFGNPLGRNGTLSWGMGVRSLRLDRGEGSLELLFLKTLE
ncbi:hypothetical protein CK203_050255 [Vitis vinifera]|uniref:Uncharacterized protein n=1 Tax=Vitis vinifera TaxID=29760 RepID=A0A438GZB2_VITVI|nr:hypothetical protein CK203_050255 [Vitis vinifera]